MDLVHRLGTNEKVEQEGWLLKQGKHFEPKHDGEHSGAKPKAFRLAADGIFSGKERKRYFVLVKKEKVAKKSENKPGKSKGQNQNEEASAFIYYYMKKPKIVKDKLKPDVEKRARKTLTKKDLLPTAIARDVGTVLNSTNFKGRIDLTQETKVYKSDESGIIIECVGRKWYLRPEESKNDADALLTAGQWVESISNVVRWLVKTNLTERDEIRNKLASRMSTTFFNGESPLPPGLSGRLSFRGSRSPSVIAMPEKIPDSLKDILANAVYKQEFTEFLDFSRATENLIFYDKVLEYEELTEQLMKEKKWDDIRTFAGSICKSYIAEGSEFQVNISSRQRKKLLDVMKNKDSVVDDTMFAEARREIFLLMETNFFQRFYKELLKRTGCFAALYISFDLDGYNVVLSNHFGRVRTETERLKSYLVSRLEQAEKQIVVLKDSLRFSHEVAAPQFESTAETLISLYATAMYRLDELETYRGQLAENVDRLNTFISSLNEKLNTIIASDKIKIKDYEDLVNLVEMSENKEREIKLINAMFKQNALSPEEVANKLKVYRITPDNIDKEFEKSEHETKILKNKEIEEKMILREELSYSLNTLEKVDLHRLHTQQEILKNVIAAENYMNENILLHLKESSKTAKKTDVEGDIKNFARSLNESLTDRVFT